MQLIMAGLNIAGAPVEVLESVAINRHALPAWLPRLASHAGGGAILSTCNRTEVYAEAEEVDAGKQRLVEFLGRLAARSGHAPDLSPFVYTLHGEDVVRHLFRVSAGLDSLALGEAQIAGQVADALTAAGEAGSLQPRVSKLFHAAMWTGRRVRQKTGLGRDRVSVPSIGVQLIERLLPGLGGRVALLVGAGETGELLARALRTAGIGKLIVCSRRPQRAAAISKELGAEVVPFEDRVSALANADVLVTCTAATLPVIHASDVEAVMSARQDRPLLVLDVGMPRDVEASAGEISGVSLQTLQSLEQIAAEHRHSRRQAAARADALIDLEVTHFAERLTSVEHEPVIRALGARAELTRQAELERALRKMPDLTSEQRTVIAAMSRSIVNRLLAEPIEYLRTAGSQDAADAVSQVFALDDEDYRP